ncbi:hypothetical protein BBJ29_010118 [Phytophthora kernoviae]|uniref:Uncharacterized protein n=1 Tax=Phytophthora kernoviae TaxID=325452 RepID=A0A3F2RCQ7_9STRA|nr:hypothetical protein BBP00_00010100 [Phytophthora kernoviae]RLN60062.1 hypothetical protein BBJ29_010118 [Phytophthora kernoviae]
MMTDAREKVDALLSERLSELNETQLKIAYQLLLHASGVMDACLESMNITPRSIGADFADLGAKPEAEAATVNPPAPGLAEDLAMLKRVPDLADGHLPQLLAWIALAEAQELVVLRGVTRGVVDFSLMAKLSMDISARMPYLRHSKTSLLGLDCGRTHSILLRL